jgi:hypothetical protein
MLPWQTFVVPSQGDELWKLKLPEMVPVAGATPGMMVRFSDVYVRVVPSTVGAGLTEVQVTSALFPTMVKSPAYCEPGYTLFVMVKLQLGAVCTKVHVIGSVMTCNPTEQVVLTISVVTL